MKIINKNDARLARIEDAMSGLMSYDGNGNRGIILAYITEYELLCERRAYLRTHPEVSYEILDGECRFSDSDEMHYRLWKPTDFQWWCRPEYRVAA